MDEEKNTGVFPPVTGRRWPSALKPPTAEPEAEPIPEEPTGVFEPAVEDVAEDFFADAGDTGIFPVTEPETEDFFAEKEAPEEKLPEAEPEAEPTPEEPTAPVPDLRRVEKKPAAEKKTAAGKKKKKKKKKAKKPAPEAEPETDPREEERNYRPIRTRRDSRIGCLGGLMYAVFIICASTVLAVFAWISAADVLALNKAPLTVEVTLPESAFSDKEIEVKEDGVVVGTKTIRAADVNTVATVLKDNGLINYKWLFKLYSAFSNADRQIDPGTYELSTTLDYRALVKKMQAGADSQLQTLVMFPEGYNLDQIFTKLEDEGVCSRKELYAAAADAEFSYAFLEGAETGDSYRLEGFLFPDTYYFYQGMQAASAINKFLSNFHYRITDEMWQQTKALNLSFRELITIASIIEKEAANDDERATIASVIYNRLERDMPLQVDATVMYALRDDGYTRLTTDLIQSTDSPYNTYRYNGLPPGPICSPGMASIQAALNPEFSYYLFYALDVESGTHRFFTNLEEHTAFVATQNYG